MLVSDEILIKINNKMSEIEKIEDLDKKAEMLNEVKKLKNKYKSALEQEQEEINDLKDERGNLKMENKELMELRAKEEKVFANYVRTAIANDMTAGGNGGALIPTTISSRIIEKVEEVCPIYQRATKFNVGGDLIFPKESEAPTCTYMDEMADGGSGTGSTFTTVKLEAFVARALSKVSRSLINRTDFDLVNYVVNAVAKSIARFLEKELINGTVGKINGLKAVTAETVSAVNADALIDLQMAVPSELQSGCEWLMNPSDVKVVRKLKDGNGQFLFQADATAEFGYRILGKNVMMSEQVPAQTFFYGDFSGLYVKLAKDVEVQVLLEKYADQYCVGVLGFVEADADVVEDQKIKAIKVQA